MTGAIRIRPAAARESERLTGLAIRSKAHWGYSPEFMRACRAELSVSPEAITHPRFEYLVAESGGGIVGFCALARLSVEEYELEALFVEPPHIGRGVGRALIEAAKARARACGARSIRIQGDPNATRFYRAAGGIRVGERESDSIPGRWLPEYRIDLCPDDVGQPPDMAEKT